MEDSLFNEDYLAAEREFFVAVEGQMDRLALCMSMLDTVENHGVCKDMMVALETTNPGVLGDYSPLMFTEEMTDMYSDIATEALKKTLSDALGKLWKAFRELVAKSVRWIVKQLNAFADTLSKQTKDFESDPKALTKAIKEATTDAPYADDPVIVEKVEAKIYAPKAFQALAKTRTEFVEYLVKQKLPSYVTVSTTMTIALSKIIDGNIEVLEETNGGKGIRLDYEGDLVRLKHRRNLDHMEAIGPFIKHMKDAYGVSFSFDQPNSFEETTATYNEFMASINESKQMRSEMLKSFIPAEERAEKDKEWMFEDLIDIGALFTLAESVSPFEDLLKRVDDKKIELDTMPTDLSVPSEQKMAQRLLSNRRNLLTLIKQQYNVTTRVMDEYYTMARRLLDFRQAQEDVLNYLRDIQKQAEKQMADKKDDDVSTEHHYNRTEGSMEFSIDTGSRLGRYFD